MYDTHSNNSSKAHSRIIASLVTTVIMLTWCSSAQAFKREFFGTWSLQCVNDAGKESLENSECVMTQVLKADASGGPILITELRLGALKPKYGQEKREPLAVFVLPLGSTLKVPPKLFLDGAFVNNLSVSHCWHDGCYFIQPLTSSLLERFLRMQGGEIKVVEDSDELGSLPISGSGSRAAHVKFLELSSN